MEISSEAILFIPSLLYQLSFFLLIYVISLMIVIYFKYGHKIEEIKVKEKRDLPYITVVIPLYNDEENIIYTVSSILTANYPQEKVEVIVVDDCSKDRSYERAKMFEEFGVKVFKTKKNSGAAHAKNVGIFNSSDKSKIIVTIDSDSVIEENALRRIVSEFERGVGAVSGAVRTKKPTNLIQKLQHLDYDIILFVRKILEFFDSVSITPGGMSAFDRKVMMELNGFNEEALTEDQEIAFRLQKRGYKIKTSIDAFSYTEIPDNLDGFIKQRIRWVRGGLQNRFMHREMLNPKYGDFAFLGILLDIMYSFPIVMMIFSEVLKFMLKRPYLFVFKINPIEQILISVTFHTLLALFLLSFFFWWSIYMINTIRKRAGEEKVSLKEVPYLIIYSIIYPVVWTYIWVLVIIKEIRGEGRKWETRD